MVILSTFSTFKLIAPSVNGAAVRFLRSAFTAIALLAGAFLATEGAAGQTLRIVAVGDSLFAGYGVGPNKGFVPQLQTWLSGHDADVEVLNAGVSGDTTAGGLVRIDWSVGEEADGVILSLGANDMLRGIDPMETRRNLEAMLMRLSERGLPVLLVGMRAGSNLGPEYREAFDAIYPELAERHSVPLYPFLLEGVALEPDLNQADGIHPNPEGVEVIVQSIGPSVLAFAESIRTGD